MSLLVFANFNARHFLQLMILASSLCMGFDVSAAGSKEAPKVRRPSHSARSEDKQPPQGSIEVDDKNFREIFESRSKEPIAPRVSEGASEHASVGLTFMRMQEFRLSNDYFEVDHRSTVSSSPGIMLGASTTLAPIGGGATLSAVGQVGYSYYEGTGTVASRRGLILRDNLSLQVLPLAAGLEVKKTIVSSAGIALSLTPLVGALYMDQKGQIDGVNQATWISSWGARAKLSLLEKSLSSSSMSFGGLALSATHTQGFGFPFQGLTYELSCSISL